MKKLSMMLLTLMSTAAFASTTKVGNGDDGTDLEGAEPITKGIIFETREKAIANLKALNIHGIAGLGLLIPELEHNQLLMTKSDVNPMSSEGYWESSDDRKTVYARTFAEPHAPTRFFPAALKLNRDQLIALHTHEALHRALPADIRENEEKVAILTMAITSPSATFDRVNQIAMSVTQLPEGRVTAATTTATSVQTSVELPPAHKSQVKLEHTSASEYFREAPVSNIEKVSFAFSPVDTIALWKKPVEPRITTEGILLYDSEEAGYHIGPLTLNAKAPAMISPGFSIGPMVQFSLKSIEHDSKYYQMERDVYTVGGIVETESLRSYQRTALTYTLPGTYQPQIYYDSQGHVYNQDKLPVGAVWSMIYHGGAKVRRFTLGGIAELHHSTGLAYSDAFTVIRGGPELKFSYRRLTVGASGIIMLNRGYSTLTDLGDLAGHGTGKHSANLSLAVDL